MSALLGTTGAQPSVPAPGSLVAYFPFDEGVNDVRNAISGTAVSGSLGSPLSPPLTGNAAVTSSCGHDGGAGLSLSGGYVNYGTPSALGRQYSSTAKSAAGYTFGTNGRANLVNKRSSQNPGPGEYAWNSTLGIQSTSRYKTSGGFKFGTSERLSLASGLVG